MNHISQFDKNDWDHLHDVIMCATAQKTTMTQRIAVFNSLPEELKEEAYECGMNDTCVREKIIEHLLEELKDK